MESGDYSFLPVLKKQFSCSMYFTTLFLSYVDHVEFFYESVLVVLQVVAEYSIFPCLNHPCKYTFHVIRIILELKFKCSSWLVVFRILILEWFLQELQLCVLILYDQHYQSIIYVIALHLHSQFVTSGFIFWLFVHMIFQRIKFGLGPDRKLKFPSHQHKIHAFRS